MDIEGGALRGKDGGGKTLADIIQTCNIHCAFGRYLYDGINETGEMNLTALYSGKTVEEAKANIKNKFENAGNKDKIETRILNDSS